MSGNILCAQGPIRGFQAPWRRLRGQQSAAWLLCALVACLLLARVGAQRPTGYVWGRDAQKAILKDTLSSGVATAAARRPSLAAVPDPDLGYNPATRKAVYLCSGMAVGPDAVIGHKHTHGGAHGRTLHASTAAAGGPDPIDPSLAFKLHSRPGARFVLLLDFTGHVTRDTQWNRDVGMASIVSPPYDIDGDSTTFSSQERANIIAIWRAVAEDFAPFRVDVTTEETDAAGRPVSLTDRGSRIVVGGSSYDWLGDRAGGIAFVDAFGYDYMQPAFVFPAQLANASTKAIWEAASHELGHTLGLTHDTTGNGGFYYWGHADWAPIMGAAYNRSVSQWDRGEFSGADNFEDDVAIITYRLGRAPDDHGGSWATATPLAPGRAVAGQIARPTDVDMFAFNASAGAASFTLSVVPDYQGIPRTNLDASVTLWSACNATAPLAVWDPQGARLRGRRSFTLPAAGAYYLAVRGAGNGTPKARRPSIGYSSYGSLGDYSLAVRYVPAPPLAPPCGLPLRRTDV